MFKRALDSSQSCLLRPAPLQGGHPWPISFTGRIAIPALFTTLFAGGIASPVLAQCPPVTVGPITQQTELAISTFDNSCTLSPTDGDGGYLRSGGGPYKLHVDTEVTGHCQQRNYFFPIGCTNTILWTRTIASTTQWINGSQVSTVSPVPGETIQDYDTRTSTNTYSGGTTWYATVLGAKYEYTSITGAVATNCSISPTSFPQNNTVTVHALSCKPQFEVGRFHPAPNSTVQIYLPSALASLASDLDYAINQWNLYLAIQSVQFQRVGSPCGTGPSCINVEVTNLGDDCGFARWGPGDTATGFHTGGLKIQLNTTWQSWSSDSSRRTFGHELQHLLGLANFEDYCLNESDAIMNPNYSCGSEAHPATAVTKNDHIPVLNTVYDGKSGRSCGF
jgi:hypothetical protein